MRPLHLLPALLAFAAAIPSFKSDPKPLPLIIWHGLGDAYDADGLHSTGELAQEVNPGTFVYYIRTDDDSKTDRSNTFFGNITTQLTEVCEALHEEPGLLDPDDKTRIRVDALGFSQGGQFLRGLVEKCDGLSVRSLVTFGSQHNGIAEFQHCDTFDLLCKGATGLIKGNAWTEYIQGKVVPAQYYRTVNETTGEPTKEYLENSNFLADINNEREQRNREYRRRLMELEKFVMYVFEDDVTVVPKESGWFAEVNATSGEVTPLRERKIYKQDWLGFKTLDAKGALVFRNTTGKHMELSDKDLRAAFEEFFGPEKEKEQRRGCEEAIGSRNVDLSGPCRTYKVFRLREVALIMGDELAARYWRERWMKIQEEIWEWAKHIEVTVTEASVDECLDFYDEDICLTAEYNIADTGEEDQQVDDGMDDEVEDELDDEMDDEVEVEVEVDDGHDEECDVEIISDNCVGRDCVWSWILEWWDSLSWLEKRKWEWDASWQPWLNGDLARMKDAAKTPKTDL